MDEIENKSASTPTPDTIDLREQIESLRHLVGSILVLLVIVSGTLTIFLLREMKNTARELEGFRAGATNVITLYQKQQGPAMDEFIKKIQQYGQAHKDFDPILTKYGLKPPTGAPPAAVPQPSATSPKK
jgi:hypothetical protein